MVNVFRYCLTLSLLSIALVGCAGQNDQQEGMNNNPDNVGYNNQDGADNNRNAGENNQNILGNDDDAGQNQLNGGNDDNITRDNGNVGDDNAGNAGNQGQNQNRMEVADKAADRVAQLKEVRQANVLTTENNAYVAAILEDGQEGQLPDKVKNKIAKKVKAVDPNIENVNVSTNPDFVDRVRQYTNAVDRGEPVEGMFEQLNEGIQRLFPDAE